MHIFCFGLSSFNNSDFGRIMVFMTVLPTCRDGNVETYRVSIAVNCLKSGGEQNVWSTNKINCNLEAVYYGYRIYHRAFGMHRIVSHALCYLLRFFSH